jgi:cytochrome c554/c'-like protein
MGEMKRSPLFSTLLCVLSMALMIPFFSFEKPATAYPAPQQQAETPMATDERLEAPGWWPTKQTASLDDFVGTKECARCHAKIAATQTETPMAIAASLAVDSTALREHDRLLQQAGPYTFTISKDEAARTYTVSDGAHSISEPLGWAFGLGNKGQTYVFQRNGAFYESRMSFFRSLQGLDLTPGHSPKTPPILDQALGQRLDPETVRRCFGCHTTAATTRAGFNPSRLVLGVDCEACHGPGGKHSELMDDEKNAAGRQAIFDPRSLGPVAQVDFCGACHRTSYDVFETKTKGVERVRFQPYRLEESRCWGDGDKRLTCIACHDPHQPLNHDSASYDEKCLTCHASSRSQKRTPGHPGKACPVAAKNCVTCHMPQVPLPSMHAPFTDHRIRIVRANSTYPD